jgi:hypothetical protein
MFRHQAWHITKGELLIVEQHTYSDDHAQGYYDPDYNEIVITDEAKYRNTDQLDTAEHCLILAKIHTRWPTARIIREDSHITQPTSSGS